MHRIIAHASLICALLVAIGARAPFVRAADESAAPAAVSAPGGVSAGDTPSDGGGSITVRWNQVAGALRYRIDRAEGEGKFDSVDIALAKCRV